MPKRKIALRAESARFVRRTDSATALVLDPGRICRHAEFPSEALGNRRTVSVWLPPGYDSATRRYSALYMHDGQNLFDAANSAFGKIWEADKTAARLIAGRRIEPIIIVAIDNTPARLDEYTVHWDASKKAGGRGRDYARFVLDEVKPFIDRNYRTLPDREHSAVAGSSLGGLISLTMAAEHADRLAMCAAFSPALWWNRGHVLRDFRRDPAWMKTIRFWVDMGTNEGQMRGGVSQEIQRTRKLIQRFDAAGLFPGRDYYYSEVAGGEHNETHWAARFDKMLLYFFGRHAEPAGNAE